MFRDCGCKLCYWLKSQTAAAAAADWMAKILECLILLTPVDRMRLVLERLTRRRPLRRRKLFSCSCLGDSDQLRRQQTFPIWSTTEKQWAPAVAVVTDTGCEMSDFTVPALKLIRCSIGIEKTPVGVCGAQDEHCPAVLFNVWCFWSAWVMLLGFDASLEAKVYY